MTNNPKNNPAEENESWDFSQFGKDSDDVFGSSSPDEEESVFDSPEDFSSPSFGDPEFGDDSAFGSSFGGDDNATFGEDDDVFPAPGEGDFGLENIPSPTSFNSSSGDPDAEFGDVDNDGFGGDDNGFSSDFGGDFSVDDDDTSNQNDFPDQEEVNDGFALPSNENGDEEEDHLFNSSSANEEEKKSGLDLKKFIFPGVAAAALLGVSYIGWGILSPMLLGDGNAPDVVISESTTTPETAFPSALPGQEGGLPLNEVSLPEVTSAEAPEATEQNNPGLSLPSLTPEVGVVAELPEVTPITIDTSVAGSPLVTEEIQVTETPSPVSELDELAGGNDRGGIDAIKGQDTGHQASVITAINDRITELENKLESQFSELNTKLDRLLPAPTQANMMPAGQFLPPTEDNGMPVPVAAKAFNPVPPLKPLIVEKASLKGVSRDMGWIDTASGVVEVKIGDALPAGGTVLNFVNYKGSWLAVTSEGLITQ